MLRKDLLNKLHAYTPTAPEEVTYKKDITTFVLTNQNCFERTLQEGHITASSWLLNKDNSKALLMHHAKLDMWVQLGGHCDGDHDVLRVAIKEAQEESGIINIEPVSTSIFDIDIHLFPKRGQEKEHFHYDIRFLLQVASNEDFTQNNESKELRWISKDLQSLPTHHPSIMRMFHKWLSL